MRLDNFLFCQEVSQAVGTTLLNLQGVMVAPLTVDFSQPRPSPDAALALPKLWAVAIFSEMEGVDELEVSWQVKLGNDVQHSVPARRARRNPEEAHTCAAQFAPFLIPRAGKYVVSVTLTADGQTRSFSKVFEVRPQPQQQLPGLIQ